MIVLARLAAILFVFLALADPAIAQSRRSADTSRAQSEAEAEIRDRINAWTIGLAGGRQEGQLQHARYCCRLFRTVDLQPPRNQHREDVHPASGGAGADEAR